MNDGYAKQSPIEFSASFANKKEIAKLIVDKLQTLHPNYNPIYLFLKWITDPKTDHIVFPPRFLDDDFEEMWSIFSQTEGISKEIEVKERLKKIFPDNKDELIDILSTAFFKNQSTEVKYFATEVSGLAAASMETYHLKNKVLDMGAMISTYEEKVATLERQAINNSAAFEAVKNDKDAKIAELERIILELKLALAVPVIVTGDIVPCTPKEPLFDAKKSYEHLKALVTLQETRLQKLEQTKIARNSISGAGLSVAGNKVDTWDSVNEPGIFTKEILEAVKEPKPKKVKNKHRKVQNSGASGCVTRTEQPIGPSLTEMSRTHETNRKELIKQTHQKPDTCMELTGWRELSALAKHLNIDLSDIYVFLTSDGKVEIREHVMFPSKETLDQIGNSPLPQSTH